MHTCIPYKSAAAGWESCTSPLLRVENGRLLSRSPSSRAALAPSRRENNSSITERSEGKKSQARRRPLLLLWSPSLTPRPHPHRPQLGEGGDAAVRRGPALLRQNKAHRGSPRPRTEPVTKAGGRRRAPSRRSCGGAGRRPGRWGAICTLFFLSCSLLLLCTQWPVRVTRRSPLRCPAPLSPSPVSFSVPNLPAFFSALFHLPLLLPLPFFFFNLFPFFFSIEKQCWFDFWKPLWAFKRQFERPYRAVLRGKEVMGPS